jgi:predicted amidohydrolase
MQIVAVQLDMVWEDKAANHARLRQLLESTEIEPGSLIVVPEMFETGFSMNLDVTAQCELRQGEAFLAELAQQHQATVLGGVAGEIVKGKSCNQAVAFAPDGTELVRYQKIKPFSLSGEGDHYAPGSEPQLFTWQGVRVAPFICYDLRFPELFRQAVDRGAEMMAVIACWPAKRSEHWVRLLQARAIENLAVVVGVNRCGSEPGLAFDGRSAAFDQMGTPLFEADCEERIIKQTLDIEAARRWREKFPALRDR